MVITPKTATVSEELKKECSSPSDIPDGELSYDSAIVKWSEDRASLESCKIKHKAVVDSINVLEGKN